MRAVLMIAVLAVAVPDRQDPNTKDTKPLPEQMLGEWRMVKAVSGGNAENGDKIDGTTLIVKDKTMEIKEAQRGGHVENVAFTLDETKKPVAIDLMPQRGPGNGRETVVGIIKIDGDILTLCFGRGGGGGKRPTEFLSPPGSDVSILEFKRVNK
jgi:uncharacterized protein (TIGR03067 family)